MTEPTNDPAGLGEAAKALIEKVSEGIAGLARPWQLIRVAKAEGQASIIKTGAELTQNKLRVLGDIEVSDIKQRAMIRLLGAEERNQRNIESITDKALRQLDNDAKPQEIKSDWIAHVFEKCKTVSDDEAQCLWARIIAGEASQPGSFSKRAIETLALLEKRDAELFTALCGFGWKLGERIFPLYCDTQADIYKSRSINFDNMNHLASIGLLSFSGSIPYHLNLKGEHIFLQYFGLLIPGQFNKQSDNTLPIGLALLTPLGAELAKICGATPVEGFLEYAVSWWKRNGLSISAPPATAITSCDWCKHLGRQSYSGSSWSQGENAIHFCCDHMSAFQHGMGDTTQEMARVSNHEAIQAWKAAGFPKPRPFFDEWKLKH